MEFNIQYKRGAHHNYLVLPCEEEKDYQFGMFTENKVPGLLSAEVRMNNGIEELYYEISSLQPLYRLYEHKGMGTGDYKKFIRGLVKAFEGIEEFLLDETKVMLEPKYIFMNPESGEVRLLFYPYNQQEEGFLRLTEYFMDHAQHDDGAAVKIAYDAYKLVRQENFVIGDFRELLERSENYVSQDRESQSEHGGFKEDEESSFDSTYKEDREDEIERTREETKNIVNEEIEMEPDAPKEEKRTMGLFKSAKKKEEKKKGGLSKLAGFLLKPKEEEEEIEEKEEENIYTEKIFAPKNMIVEEKKATPAPPKEEYGKTTFFENLEEEEERVLRQTNKGKEHTFNLENLPKTLGKLEESVDYCVRDGSISRIHARFVEKNGRIYVEDCNSTNGTFVNGVRLNEEESVLIEAGDELRFGKVTFLYN